MKINKRRIVKLLLFSLALVPLILIASLFLAPVQKYLFQTQLTPWLKETQAEYIHITPFSIKIKQLHLKYDAIDVNIGHLDTEFSPFELLIGRIKIDKFILNNTLIDDQSIAGQPTNSGTFLFPGLFPYLDIGYIIDIGKLDIDLLYQSSATGQLSLQASAANINEQFSQPLNIHLMAPDLKDIPDIKKATLNASIFLNQHLIKPIDRQNSSLKLQLETNEGALQDISLELAMEQLPQPEMWASYPFDKRGNHYLTKILHPEKIMLELRHSQDDNLLSELFFDGIYDGNEGVISGTLELLTEKGFLALFKSLQLPEIESELTAQFSYNTRTLDGSVQLKDQLNIRHYLENNHSLPDELAIDNHLSMKLDGDFMQIDSFLLNILSQKKEYIKLLSHKPLNINLRNIQALLDQQQSDLFTVTINQLPLEWFNDFIPDLHFQSGYIDTDINLSVAQRALLLKTRRPFTLHNLALIKSTPPSKPELTLMDKQFVETDFNIQISDRNLSAVLEHLDLYQLTDSSVGTAATESASKDKNRKINRQLSTSLKFNVQAPVSANLLASPFNLNAQGKININEIINIPLIKHALETALITQPEQPLVKSLPGQLNLNYQLALNGRDKLWTIEKSDIILNAKNHPDILQLNNLQNIQLKQEPEQFVLQSKDSLMALKINHFDFKWLEPVIRQYAAPYKVSGKLSRLNAVLGSKTRDQYNLHIQQLAFSNLALSDDQQALFSRLALNLNARVNYTPDKLTVNYPQLSITQSGSSLLSNKGSVVITHLDKTDPGIYLKGSLNGHIHQLMKLRLVNQFTHKTIRKPSILDAQYQLGLHNNQLDISELLLSVFHPLSKGRLDLKTHKPIKISLSDAKQNFAQNGYLSLKLTNFDISPYEVLFPQLPITFDSASARINLVQKNRKQTIKFQQPLHLHNVHYKNPKTALLNPFDVLLDIQAVQSGKQTTAHIKQLSLQFKGQKNRALALNADLKYHSGKTMPITGLNADLNVLLTQWFSQPGIMPDNTLTRGTLTADISLDNTHRLKHKWQINDLGDNNKQQLIKSVLIDGTGEIKNLNDLFLEFPLIMQSQSGTTELTLKNHIQIKKDAPSLAIDVHGKEIFLNDILKLLAAINPDSELSKLEKENTATEKMEKTSLPAAPDNTPAQTPFWPTGLDILAHLDIQKLYYSDYMSYHNIRGQLDINREHLIAKDFAIRFHESPMTLNADFKFTPKRKQPYDIRLITALSHFNVGGFLKELKPDHVPRADGVFDVDVLFYGPLSNLTQIRNELMFKIDISGVNGVYHLIPSDNVMARSGGQAMAVVGEVVSVLPTSGFGLGIINRVVRFAKDIEYDLIRMSMSRQKDLNTHIDIFEILSPELHLIADGDITFAPDTRLMDQDLKMQADLNLSGEGAAIFYGLGLLKEEQDEYGFWKGPTIKFWGSISNMEDNFDEIINKAKEGTLVGGITNPFSGLVGNFKYRWTGTRPDYSKLLNQYKKPELKNEKNRQTIETK